MPRGWKEEEPLPSPVPALLRGETEASAGEETCSAGGGSGSGLTRRPQIPSGSLLPQHRLPFSYPGPRSRACFFAHEVGQVILTCQGCNALRARRAPRAAPRAQCPPPTPPWVGFEDTQGDVCLCVPWLRGWGWTKGWDMGLASSETPGELQALSKPQLLRLHGRVSATHLPGLPQNPRTHAGGLLTWPHSHRGIEGVQG